MRPISEWSALDSESNPTSSRPVAASPPSTMRPIASMPRSRTGRVTMPAWQNRQPRVHPRKISTEYRSCTVSASGTTGAFGYGHSSRLCSVYFSTRVGTPGRFGRTEARRPSGA